MKTYVFLNTEVNELKSKNNKLLPRQEEIAEVNEIVMVFNLLDEMIKILIVSLIWAKLEYAAVV